MKPKLMFYCQHVLGMGHMVRSRELVRAMTDFEVWFINGGEPVEGFEFPPNVRVVQLPPVASDAEFRSIDATDSIRERRRETLSNLYEDVAPDVLMIEMFPFGRRKFAFELLPLLEENVLRGRPARVVSSVRDILVSKRDQARHEEFACRVLNESFDLVLVHADPAFRRLEESFGRFADLKVPVLHTGFVTEPFEGVSVPRGAEPRIVASVGGGRVGFELLDSVITASLLLAQPHSLSVFAGPYQPEEQFAILEQRAAEAPWIRVTRYAPDFVAQMASADLSISMAGYNTCMNIVSTGCKAFVYPFTGNGNEEQTVRARKLESMGALNVLNNEDLTPPRLTSLIAEQLTSPRSRRASLDLDGARKSAIAIANILEGAHA